MSAVSGEGVAEFLALVETQITSKQKLLSVQVPTEDGASLSWIYRNGTVLNRSDTEDFVTLEVKFSTENLGRVIKMPVTIL